MGVAIDWGVLRPQPDLGAVFSRGFDRGRARGALGVLSRDPSNVDALAGLAEVAPDALYKFQGAQRQQADWGRGERFRDALATYQRNGLVNPSPAPDALGASSGARGNHAPYADQRGPALGNTLADAVPNSVPDALAGSAESSEIVVQGRRPPVIRPAAPMRAPGGAGWDSVISADPVAAMKAAGDIWGSRKEHLEDWQHVSSRAAALLGGVHDQASYDQARVQARRQYEAFGISFDDVDAGLPDEYSPEAIRDIQMQHLDLEDQVRAAMQERRFEWDRDDDELDNARADRNTNSQIQDRDARRGLTVRGQNMTDARGRYGISVASGDRRRGQDMTDSRLRSTSRPTRGASRGGGGAAAGPALTRIAVGPDGKKVGWNGKAWVPAQ